MNLTMNPLPPQAYTKDTLVKALQWLISQPNHIREMAATEDLAVSLYLKCQREGAESLERPSIKNFKSELKNLAGLMGNLEKTSDNDSHLGHQQQLQPQVQSHNQTQTQTQTQMSQHHVQPQAQTQAQTQTQTQAQAQVQSAKSQSISMPAKTLDFILDEKSLMILNEVKLGLNLGSDVETLRLLITLGYSKSKQILKDLA
jgi:hypothetical protein